MTRRDTYDSNRWRAYFLRMALLSASMSKDPSTRVGAVIADDEGIVLATGFNGFPRGIYDTAERLENRETKLKLIVHAEANAIAAAAHNGVKLDFSTMYIACEGGSGEGVWGGPPCVRCAMLCIQAGIKQIVYYPMKSAFSKWTEDLLESLQLLDEAGIPCHQHAPTAGLGLTQALRE